MGMSVSHGIGETVAPQVAPVPSGRVPFSYSAPLPSGSRDSFVLPAGRVTALAIVSVTGSQPLALYPTTDYNLHISSLPLLVDSSLVLALVAGLAIPVTGWVVQNNGAGTCTWQITGIHKPA